MKSKGHNFPISHAENETRTLFDDHKYDKYGRWFGNKSMQCGTAAAALQSCMIHAITHAASFGVAEVTDVTGRHHWRPT
jgi:hypothetical protein